jgi:hypothetical protein
MADDTTTTPDTPPAAADVPPVTGPSPDGASTDAQTAVSADQTPVTVNVTAGSAPAQVQGPVPASQGTVEVHETHVRADRVITDTSDPLAVQVPPAGVGDALTPIGRAYQDPRTPEDVFLAENA